MASESLPTEWSWISCSIKAIKARCHYPVSPPPNKKNASHGLTGFQLLISAGKCLPLIFILLNSNTLHKSAAREVKN